MNIETIEINLLLRGIYECHGYDFRDYAPSFIKRRVMVAVRDEGVDTISHLQSKILHDSRSMKRFLLTLSVDVSSMFRDPRFYISLMKEILLMQREPHIRIWSAGCSGGDEVYSLAIMLHEASIYNKTKIYATDINDELLERGKQGIFQIKKMKEYTSNYQKAGGSRPFSEYYTAHYGNSLFRSFLRKNIVWASHNLAQDSSFNEFHIILCRNVMIYFNKSLQDRVHRLFYESLAQGGILAIGNKESLKFTPYESCYEEINGREKIYRKMK